jgi:hypothetical protein
VPCPRACPGNLLVSIATAWAPVTPLPSPSAMAEGCAPEALSAARWPLAPWPAWSSLTLVNPPLLSLCDTGASVAAAQDLVGIGWSEGWPGLLPRRQPHPRRQWSPRQGPGFPALVPAKAWPSPSPIAWGSESQRAAPGMGHVCMSLADTPRRDSLGRFPGGTGRQNREMGFTPCSENNPGCPASP